MSTSYQKVKGKIARIIDSKTVVINLGSEHGIDSDSIFFILGEPENIVDPDTKEVLGSVSVTKSRLKASQVFEKFTIARTSWTVYRYHTTKGIYGLFPSAGQIETSVEEVDEGPLRVLEQELQPWKARS